MADTDTPTTGAGRTCIECDEPWPCEATVTRRKDGIPHRLGFSKEAPLVQILIPKGSVLVTEETLDAALEDAALDALLNAPHPDLAAAILDRIREGQR